jgi:hypothetical protein
MAEVEVECPIQGCRGRLKAAGEAGQAFGEAGSWEVLESRCTACGGEFEVHLKQAVDIVRRTGGKTELVRRVVLGD